MGTALAKVNSRTTDHWSTMCDGYEGNPNMVPASESLPSHGGRETNMSLLNRLR